MRQYGGKAIVAVLAPLLSVMTAMAVPATAAVHHHHHHHHRRGGGGGCGPGTTNQGGVCIPTGTPGPTGNSNVKITPSDVTMTLNGQFTATAEVTGLPPFTTIITEKAPVFVLGFTIPVPGQPCGPKVTPIPGIPVAFTGEILYGGGQADATGRYVTSLRTIGSCVPGTYPITFTEPASPFQTFTGFITLHF
ncbi:MAG: hypothetical protein JOZ37_18725 [Actinobacteria bacterium]|nr:hypothetical protein [Actinomycetota bacterium]MBV9666005.1 hypothetical protein [Actinomycetota bacterium]MBV9936159.1 hypothetical protein [Actinomycetota bacterium]